MQPKVIFGNAQTEGKKRWGWILGHFVTPTDDPRSTTDLEVKWAVHQAGDSRDQWATNEEATTLSILIKGRFRLQFPEQEVLLSGEGDYVIWVPGVAHSWSAVEDSIILTVRWPSISGDSVEVG
ncbi:signal peptidase I [Trichocoleus sp. FACHB-90]|uniref:signal peptidase I n=1 Tax=Cyanophyceae TaxID=3028117 RepID=UPI00168597A5|nr:signal peptidase I [Trichocoleus sp. FACHB-90]MBD1927680.1 signal peptidase I [Trichocoleus sp. FACHB-90]